MFNVGVVLEKQDKEKQLFQKMNKILKNKIRLKNNRKRKVNILKVVLEKSPEGGWLFQMMKTICKILQLRNRNKNLQLNYRKQKKKKNHQFLVNRFYKV